MEMCLFSEGLCCLDCIKHVLALACPMLTLEEEVVRTQEACPSR